MYAKESHANDGRRSPCVSAILRFFQTPKPITVRQCAQALPNFLRDKPGLTEEVGQAITRIDLMTYKGTMPKRILIDFLDALLVWKTQPTLELQEYFLSALFGSILDEKSKNGSFQ